MIKEKNTALVGTILAILIGLGSEILFNVGGDIAILIGFSVEIICLLIQMIVDLEKMEGRIVERIVNSSELSQAIHRLSLVEDKQFSEKYRELYKKLIRLSQGSYTVRLRSDIYLENTNALDLLEPNETFRATVPVSASDVVGQLSDEYFGYYLSKQIEIAQKGVRVIRIYIFPNEAIFDAPEVKKHLDRLIENQIEVRVLFKSMPVSHRLAELFESDFLIFGKRKVSVGQLGTADSVVISTQFSIAPETVEKYLQNFKTLYDISESYPREIGDYIPGAVR
jgi:hypothetical protein